MRRRWQKARGDRSVGIFELTLRLAIGIKGKREGIPRAARLPRHQRAQLLAQDEIVRGHTGRKLRVVGLAAQHLGQLAADRFVFVLVLEPTAYEIVSLRRVGVQDRRKLVQYFLLSENVHGWHLLLCKTI